MALSKVIEAQEREGFYIANWLPDNKYGLNWPKKRLAKITPKVARLALSGDPTAMTSEINHSIFTKLP